MGRCLTPLIVKNSEHKIVAGAPRYIKVPCGCCVECYKRYLSTWAARLQLETREEQAYFLTLTYDDEHIPEDGVSKTDVQTFHKSVRRFYKSTFQEDSPMKYVLISEYGPTTFRPHYHGLYFHLQGLENYVDRLWTKGFVTIDPVTPARLAYVMSFHFLKHDNVKDGKNPNFRLMSKGLGLENFEKFELVNAINNDWDWMINDSCQRVGIARYFRKKFGIDKSGSVEPIKPPLDDHRSLKQQVADIKATNETRLQQFLKKKRKTKKF